MPEYVYALHDFIPENEDEVTFYAGERIEVIEKDDMYEDGWWHGRNLAGDIGLFPVSYTAPAPRVAPTSHALTSPEPLSQPPGLSTTNTRSVLHPLVEELDSETPGHDIVSPVPKHPTAFLNNGYNNEPPYDDDSLDHASGDNEMMKATMTDVQKAIEQLGRAAGEDGDGARSFSFASIMDGANTEASDTDFDLSDMDGTEVNGNGGEDWHKNARRKLAAKAKRASEQAEKMEEMMAENGDGRRIVAPPIDVELSDESDAEDDADLTKSTNFKRVHPHIPEEDENIGTDGETANATNGTRYSTISTADGHIPNDESQVSTATKPSFSAIQIPSSTESTPEKPTEKSPTPEKSIYPSPISPPTMAVPNIQQTLKKSTSPVREVANELPSPASVGRSSVHTSSSGPQVQQQQQPDGTSTFSRPTSIPVSTTHTRSEAPTMEWNVEEVVNWLKSKGFDQDICDKFIDQEITGDVLLELDVNLLKTEIGIMAFGKRMRIANAIAELRRPPSIEYSDHQLSPMQLLQPHSLTHSRTQSQTLSLPGTATHATHSYSILGSPRSGNGVQQMTHVYDSPVDINEDMKASGSVGMGNSVAVGIATGMSTAGLGIAMPPSLEKGPPSRLVLSSSNGLLKESAAKTVAINGEDEDRGHISDSEIALSATSIRRRLFGRSHDSALSIMNLSPLSKGNSPHSSPTMKEDKDVNDSVQDLKEKETSSEKDIPAAVRRVRSKKSTDAKASDRLSIFATFGGKNRKPPPSSDEPEKPSKFSLPRLHSSSIRKTSSTASNRGSSSTVSPQRSPNNFTGVFDEKGKDRHSVTLRKRTPSNAGATSPNAKANGTGTGKSESGVIKEGVNIVDQIGEPDFTGWMRKKADRYNSWKLRYFILKGPHLYYLRSDSKTENRIKGYIHIDGYKVTVDETVDPGRYGFRIDHDKDKTHYFSSDEKNIIRDWMKAIMKATILRDYAKPVLSSCNIPTIPLVVAQAMNPAPRPPSPTARDATQRALRRSNTEQLSTRDTRVLMGLSLADAKDERARLDAFFSNEATAERNGSASSPPFSAPPRPSKLARVESGRAMINHPVDDSLIQWANSHLPESLQITDTTGLLCTGLGLLRIAESIKGRPSSPPVPDSAFPTTVHDDKLDGLFRLFDFLLDNDVKMGSVSINDVRLGKRDKIVQLLKALKNWEDKRKMLDLNNGKATVPSAFMSPPVIA